MFIYFRALVIGIRQNQVYLIYLPIPLDTPWAQAAIHQLHIGVTRDKRWIFWFCSVPLSSYCPLPEQALSRERIHQVEFLRYCHKVYAKLIALDGTGEKRRTFHAQQKIDRRYSTLHASHSTEVNINGRWDFWRQYKTFENVARVDLVSRRSSFLCWLVFLVFQLFYWKGPLSQHCLQYRYNHIHHRAREKHTKRRSTMTK